MVSSSALVASVNGVAIKSPYQTTDFSKVGTQKDIFRFLDGAAPYFTFPDNTSISRSVPETCKLSQVHLMSRHGERYTTTNIGNDILSTWYKISNYTEKLNGSLAFLNSPYEFFLDSANFEEETTTDNTLNPWNPFLGQSTGFKSGLEFYENYGELLGNQSNFTAFTSTSKRCHDTAVNFIKAIGDEYDFNLQIISEDKSFGANSLTPSQACANKNSSEHNDIIDSYTTQYLKDISSRLNEENKGLNITEDDTTALFSWCAFENNARGYSDMCDIFTQDELITYSYFRDLSSYYTHFVGNSWSKAIGSPLFDATLKLLTTDDADLSQKIWLSFTHDDNIIEYLAAVGLFDNGVALSAENVPFVNQVYHKSWIVPQGARIYTEKFDCTSSNGTTTSYVRYVVNDVVIPLETCNSGPGFSCELNDFVKYSEDRLKDVDYIEDCGVKKVSNNTELTFFWDFPTKNYSAPLIHG
ncbi:AKH_1a_G0042860.mRNA.1.CDS.1 [Saccharomyces cerevisiae]|nr:AKH_1a_G0042860.mRNA.1.CDS.1 [Saccharomyces cerevisiae]CAI6847979.1 AKH_1a_G0042860.mRNA.1.CDS.1 [Saccharomyces cerevisiae]